MKRPGLKPAIVLFVAVILAIIGTTPPASLSKDAPAHLFSADRAMRDVREVARAPHPTGSAENARVRAYLTQRMTDLGLRVTPMEAPLGDAAVTRLQSWLGDGQAARSAISLIGVKEGRDRSLPAVALMAHYDSVAGSPGAPDDASGIAAILEILRALNAEGQPARDIVVLMTDAEEIGLEGAKAFFAEHPLRSRTGTVINLEARGGGGRTSLFETSAENGEAIRRYAAAVSRPAGTSLSVFIYRLLPNGTDLTPVLRSDAGATAYNFAFIGRPELYHSPQATPERLDRGSLQDMGAQALDLTRALAGGAPLPRTAGDVVFFDVFGLFAVVYPPVIAWVMLAIAVGLYTAAAVGRARTRDVLRGVAAWTALLMLSAGALYAANLMSGSGGAVNYYDRLAAIPRLEVLAVAMCAACFIAISSYFLRSRRGEIGFATGAALPVFPIALMATFLAPTASFPLTVTLLLGGVGAFALVRQAGITGSAVAMLMAALVTGYMLTLGHQLMQAVGPDYPFIVAAPLSFAAVVFWQVMPAITAPRSYRYAAAGLAIVAIAIALWVRFDPIAPTIPAYSLENYRP